MLKIIPVVTKWKVEFGANGKDVNVHILAFTNLESMYEFIPKKRSLLALTVVQCLPIIQSFMITAKDKFQ